MSDFKLDIDYPYEVIHQDKLITKPDPIEYSKSNIRYRHYGRILADLIKKASEMPEGDTRDNLVALICNHMRKDYVTWNKDTIDDKKIALDLESYSNGKLQMTESVARLMQQRFAMFGRPVGERRTINIKNNQKIRRNNYKK
jgi:hypothetical protein